MKKKPKLVAEARVGSPAPVLEENTTGPLWGGLGQKETTNRGNQVPGASQDQKGPAE